jgi:hypothetical protein
MVIGNAAIAPPEGFYLLGVEVRVPEQPVAENDRLAGPASVLVIELYATNRQEGHGVWERE